MEQEACAFVWDGARMVPLDRFRNLAARQYRAGCEYVLVQWRGRSKESHNHYFACIKTAWENLPESVAASFPSPEYLRKWCLVKEGYADHTQVVVDDADQAAKLVMLARNLDPYAVIRVRENIVDIWRAQSQDHASMGHDAFQESKDKILGRVANMCGLSVKDLTKHTPQVIEHDPGSRSISTPRERSPEVGDF